MEDLILSMGENFVKLELNNANEYVLSYLLNSKFEVEIHKDLRTCLQNALNKINK
ncbi:hypothetical protein MZM54_00460 [[Brevibacterium] frigoritolerans]|nr:hypothetical protein [Peribacillus frigoritolerans]